ncbi:MAG: RNA polymerase sigma factor [Dehalococcoidales bacterium]|nr:MAG: RNA polymerase sigma factor [Dehalococcoidales bacterium]
MDNKRNTRQENINTPDVPPEDESSEIEKFVTLAINGDVEAFGELYTYHVKKIYRYVYYNVHNNKERAEDITQEVFLKAWRAIGSCKGKEKTFSSWLYRIAHNLIIDIIRKSQKQLSHEAELPEEIRDKSDGMEISLEQRDLLKVIDVLSPNQRQVILMKFIEDMDNQEIAETMGKSTGAIRILQMRALEVLRKTLSE